MKMYRIVGPHVLSATEMCSRRERELDEVDSVDDAYVDRRKKAEIEEKVRHKRRMSSMF